MVSKSLRTSIIPNNVVLLWSGTNATIPACFTNDTSLHGKFLKQVVNSCTNPGGTGGNATHTHACNTHNHTVCGSTSHTHNVTTTPESITNSRRVEGGGVNSSHGCHQHVKTSCGTSPTPTICNNSHNHGSISNEPQSITFAPIKKNTIVNLRKRSAPQNAIFLWPKNLACIPTAHSLHNSNLNRYVKIIPCSCTNPGTTAGNTCHTHAASSHTHTSSLASHTHTYSANWGTAPEQFSVVGGATGSVALDTHTHTFTFATSGSTAPSTTSGSSGCHTHDAKSLDVPHHTLAPIKVSSISLNKKGFPKFALGVWTGTLATIPSTFALANGSNCTPNLLDRFPKLIPNACTNPGTQAGSATHQHSCVSHGHTVNWSHTHTQTTGTSGTASTFNDTVNTCPVCATWPRAGKNHTHGINTPSTGGTLTAATLVNASHTHDCVNHRPPYIEVAFIQKL